MKAKGEKYVWEMENWQHPAAKNCNRIQLFALIIISIAHERISFQPSTAFQRLSQSTSNIYICINVYRYYIYTSYISKWNIMCKHSGRISISLLYIFM